jgi:hypothetical protein
MKSFTILLTGLLLTRSSYGSIVLNTVFGPCTNSSGNLIPDGTLWALVMSTDAGDSFAGGFGLGGSILNSGAASAEFAIGQEIAVGRSIGADSIFAIGGFTGAAQNNIGYTQDALTLELSVNLIAGRNVAFYFFPNVIFSSTETNKVGTEVGGLNATAVTAEGPFTGLSMVLPADGGDVSFGAVGTLSGGTAENMKAVVLVPEPSSILLGLLGTLSLLRRKRD